MLDVFEGIKFGDKVKLENKNYGVTDVGVITSVRLKAGFVRIANEPKPLYSEKIKGNIIVGPGFDGYYDTETGKKIHKNGKDLEDDVCVVSRWEELINEEELEQLASESAETAVFPIDDEVENYYMQGFKEGYRKAKRD